MQIRAAVISGDERVPTIETLELGALRADEIRVRIVAAGLCHTDQKVLQNAQPRPLILGHEGAGVVENVGTDVSDVAPGDHVLMSFDSCGHCPECIAGHPAYCLAFRARNFSGAREDGSVSATRSDGTAVHNRFFGQSCFATHAIATRRNLVVVPNDVDLATAAPLGCGIQTGAGTVFNVFDLTSNDTLLVVGAGAVGLSALLAANVVGARTFVSDPAPARCKMALELGAEAVFDAGDDTLAAVLAASDGGVTHSLVTAGIAAGFDLALNALGPRGMLGYVGAPATGSWEPDWGLVLRRGLSIRGVIEGDSDPQSMVPHLLQLWREGRFPYDRFVSFYPFGEIARAFSDASNGNAIKPVLRFTLSDSHPTDA